MNGVSKRMVLLVGCLAWMACGAAAFGAMGGVGREGTHVVEILAGPRDVDAGSATWTVGVPKALGPILDAAGVKTGETVLLPDQGRMAILQKKSSGWRTLSLTLKIPAGAGTVHAVERVRILPWPTFGERLKQDLLAAGKGEAECREGLENVLERIRTVFGGADMVAGFSGTEYEREFRKAKRGMDALIRLAAMKGWKMPEALGSRYRGVFGEDWPAVAAGRIWSADAENIEIREVRTGDGTVLKDVFSRALPMQADAVKGLSGLFPRGAVASIRYGRAGGGDGEGRTVPWRFAEDGVPTWFVLHAEGAETARAIGQRLENRSGIGVRATVVFGERKITAPIPAGGAAELCLVLPEGMTPQVRAEADPRQETHAGDYHVTVRMADGKVVVEGSLKARPELILNNAEMMEADVEVFCDQGNGRMARELKVQLGAGEMGYGIPATPHRAMELRCRYPSEFHQESRMAVAPLGYGDRSNVVLKAEMKRPPEVTVRNRGPVAVRLSGMESPANGVCIPPGTNATVSLPAGRRVQLTGEALVEGYRCEALELGAMDPGEKRSVDLKVAPKPSPQVVLRNTLGMMDAEARLVSASGIALGAPITVKKGETSRPMDVPPQAGMHFRLTYRNGRFTAQGRLEVPAMVRGDVKVLDIPDPATEIQVKPSGGERKAAVPAMGVHPGRGVVPRDGE